MSGLHTIAIRLLAVTLVAFTLAVEAVVGDSMGQTAPTVSYRSAQEVGLDLNIDYRAIISQQADTEQQADTDQQADAVEPTPAESIGEESAFERRHLDLSRDLERWTLDPVMAGRRQAGGLFGSETERSNKGIGFDLKRRF